jgi:hypothetical protein
LYMYLGKTQQADRISENKYRRFLSCLENNPMHHYSTQVA